MHLAQTTFHHETPSYQQPAQEYHTGFISQPVQTQQYHTGAIAAPEHHFESQQHHSFESQPRKY